jgi:hypothetical protein
VIEACAQYAFASNPYPVIFSFENHCSLSQQKIMVDIMKAEFRDSILLPGELIVGTSLPSPEQLKGKVIIKGKRSQPLIPELNSHGSIQGYSLANEATKECTFDRDSDDEAEELAQSEDVSAPCSSKRRYSFLSAKKKKAKKLHPIHPELAAMTYLKSYNMRHLKTEQDWKHLQPDVVLSCSEDQFVKMAADEHKLETMKLLCRKHIVYVVGCVYHWFNFFFHSIVTLSFFYRCGI